MNTKYFRLSIVLLCFFSFKALSQNELTGRVYNQANNKPIPFASIYIEDLKIGAICDSDGTYSLKRIPEGSFLAEVDALGYGAKADLVKVKGTTMHDFALTVFAFEEQEVVVTGNSRATDIRHTPQPITE